MLCVMSDYVCTGEWDYYATNTELSYEQMMIEIRWAKDDLYILKTHTLTPGLILATEATEATETMETTGGDADTTTTGSPGATVTVISSDPGRGGAGLSTGAQAGIGVGVGLVGLLAVGLAIFLLLRYRKERAGSKDANQAPSMQQHQPSELGDTAIGASTNLTPGQGALSVAGSQSTYLRDSVLSNNQPIQLQDNPSSVAELPSTSPSGQSPVNEAPVVAEILGNEGVARSIGGSENSQAQQEMTHLVAEQTKLDARRTRLMELTELDEEEQRIRTRMQQLESES
ncbi:hypothetical protein F4781DRAFT_97219 [Annulohypoxylon bovei var. microspora]|nr:hypothetical protein F4781DRAFT_97219 [Annulohypoxylon bovei var. microspora]